MVRIGAFVISLIALVAAGVGIMNIMLVSVTERTKEIGIRKSIGARSRDILRQFLAEAVFISQAGGILGIILGVVGGNLLAAWLEADLIFPFGWAIAGLVVCSGIGIGFGFYPAYRAASLDPDRSPPLRVVTSPAAGSYSHPAAARGMQLALTGLKCPCVSLFSRPFTDPPRASFLLHLSLAPRVAFSVEEYDALAAAIARRVEEIRARATRSRVRSLFCRARRGSREGRRISSSSISIRPSLARSISLADLRRSRARDACHGHRRRNLPQETLREGRLPDRAHCFVEKPFQLEEFGAAIRDCSACPSRKRWPRSGTTLHELKLDRL